MDKVEDIHLSISTTLSESYDYSCSKVWARLGVNFDIEQFRISPQAGLSFNMISGKVAGGVTNTTYFKIASVGSSGYYIVPGKPATLRAPIRCRPSLP